MMVMSPHRKHAEKVDTEPQRADKKELACVHLRWIDSAQARSTTYLPVGIGHYSQTFDCLEDDEDGYEDKENPVRKTGQGFDPTITNKQD